MHVSASCGRPSSLPHTFLTLARCTRHAPAVPWGSWVLPDRACCRACGRAVKMKRELFQVTESPARVDAYDLLPGSTQRWSWEVRGGGGSGGGGEWGCGWGRGE